MSAPIVPVEPGFGFNVTDIGDVRVARGLPRRYTDCRHTHLVYDPSERRIWCNDCEKDVEPFDAFKRIVENQRAIEARIAELHRLEKETLVSRAARVMDRVWRSRKSVPLCPHCNAPILAAEVADGVARMDRRFTGAVRPLHPLHPLHPSGKA